MAISALVAAEEGERANLVLPRMLSASGLDERDRGFATELAYGTLRMCRACDWLVGQFAKGDLEPAVRAAARAGAYQLAFMRVPGLCRRVGHRGRVPAPGRPLLNAVLRRIADLVAGGRSGGRAGHKAQLPRLGAEPAWVRNLGAEPGPGRPRADEQAASPSIRPDGYIQDAGSQPWGSTSPGYWRAGRDRSWTSAPRPGGKATLLAHGSPFVVGADVAPARAGLVAANAARLQLANIAVVVADGTQPPFCEESFAGVLVDAPCSGLGVLRRRPDARWRARPEDVGRLASLQERLLKAAAPLVARGGVLVYSVCTLTRKETVDIDKWTGGGLAGEWEAARPPGPPWEALGRGALLLPQAAGTDGMYVLALYRRH